jgi:hypothetical protein
MLVYDPRDLVPASQRPPVTTPARLRLLARLLRRRLHVDGATRRDGAGCTALHVAAANGRCPELQLLLDARLDHNALSHGAQWLLPIDMALLGGHVDAAALLWRAHCAGEDAAGQSPRRLFDLPRWAKDGLGLRMGDRVSRAEIFMALCQGRDHAAALRSVCFMLQNGYPGLDTPWMALHGRVAMHLAVGHVRAARGSRGED